MFIFDPHIMESTDPADDIVIHGDNTHLQTPAKLHVWFPVSQQQDVGGVSADIYQKHLQVMIQLSLEWRYRGISLRINIDIAHEDRHRLIIIAEVNGLGPFEILRELITKNAIMLRRQANGQMDSLSGIIVPCIAHFPGNSKQSQDEVAFVFCLVSAITEPLSGERPEPAFIFQHFICHRRTDRMLCQACHEAIVGCFDVVIAMINCD